MNIKKLKVAKEYIEIECPHCGWHGSNCEDVSATFHESIETEYDDNGEEYYHCTSCDENFRPKKKRKKNVFIKKWKYVEENSQDEIAVEVYLKGKKFLGCLFAEGME